jgi:hypothetical protein
MPSIEIWRTIAIVSAAVGQTSFILLYLTFPWWQNFLGRSLFFKAVALGLLVDAVVVGRIWDWRYEDATFVALYFTLSVGVWVQLVAFARVKFRKFRKTSGSQPFPETAGDPS